MRALLAFLLLFVAAPAAAQFDRLNEPELPAHTNAIQPELVLDGGAMPGTATDLAILMHTRPGWHGYWQNPGDAGLPLSVEWQLPAGWSAGPLRYPVPTRLLVSGVVNYVYEKDYAVLARLSVPAGASGLQTIRATMTWLACTEKVCVPEKGEVSLEVKAGAAAPLDKRFDQWRRALPRLLASKGAFQSTGDVYRVAIPLPRSVELPDPYVFPIDEGVIDYDAPQKFFRDGDRIVAHLKAAPGDPKEFRGVLAPGDGTGFEFAADRRPVGSSGTPIGERGTESLLWAVLGAIAGGILLNLMPCVFPILAMKAMHLARAGGNAEEARREALAYAGGAIIGTGALGAALMLLRAGGSAAGWAFQLQDPRSILLLMLLAVAVTLNLLKFFEFPVLAGERTGAGSFGAGALAAFVATPCSGPFMGVALGAALLMPLWGSAIVFAALGLGLALPFVAVAFIPALRRRLPKPGAWMERLQRFLAVPMAATVAATLWLLYRQAGSDGLMIGIGAAILLGLVLLIVGRRQRGGGNAWPVVLAGIVLIAGPGVAVLPKSGTGSVQVPLGTGQWSPAAVQRAVAKGRPAFVYFTADWCLTCKANEAAAIDRTDVQEAFREAGVVVLVGDWTNGDPAIGRFLESRGRAGVPLYLWYQPGQAPEELPQLLTPGLLIARAHRAKG